MVELHCLDQVMQEFYYKQHISSDINTSDALHAITRKGKNDNYNWFSQHGAYVS